MGVVVKSYLVLYNLASAVGWAYVLYLCYLGYAAGDSAATLWVSLKDPLTYVQTAALMEVIHSLVGVVPSPVFTVFMQVMSRILLVWGITRPYVAAQNHWSLYQMTISWGLVEVPRYLFYVKAQLPGEMPYPLFWLRYSLFMVLYPTGISGEWMQMLFSLQNSAVTDPVWYRFILITMYVLYTLGGPFMIMNMWGNRKSSFRKRAMTAAAPPPTTGLQWPITNAKKGDRSSSKTNQAIWSAAMGAVDKEAQAKLDKVKNWRFGYAKQVMKSVHVSLASKKNALAMAKAGLEEARNQFTFVADGKEVSFQDAIDSVPRNDKTFVTGVIKGSAARMKKPVLEVPYGGKDPSQPYYKFRKNEDVLTNSEVIAQLDKWEAHGTIEKSCADQIKAVVQNQGEWLDLSDKYFVLIGATSAMGPLDMLLKYGANIIALDINIPAVWERLITKVRNSSSTCYFPIEVAKAGGKAQDKMTDAELFKCAGANLFEQAPQLCHWIQGVCPGKAVTVGNYTYLDGERHVRLSIAGDAIIDTLCETRETSIAFLCTPTDIHVIPAAATEAMKKNEANSSIGQKIISALPGSWLTKNAERPITTDNGKTLHYVDGLSVAQGPNYALAKRMQHWRAIVAHENGITVSSNIAPSTATKSVVSAALFAAAYGGFHLFKPLEVMYQETSNAVMFALLIHDVVNPKAAANPKNSKLSNPYELFEFGSFHGGVWRCAYKLNTIGEVAALSYFATKYWFQGLSGVGILSSMGYWIATGIPETGYHVFSLVSDHLAKLL